MSLGKLLRFDFEPETHDNLRQVFLHPLVCGCRLLRLLGNDDKPNNLDLENIAETDATEGNLSRRRTVWDDEEEEEEY